MAALDFPNTPSVGQIATLTNGIAYRWDGTAWTGGGVTGPPGPTGPQGEPGLSAGKILYYAPSDASDIATYKTLLPSPSAGAEQTIATVCTGTSDVLVAAFATDSGVPGAVDYPAGTAYRRLYASVSAGVARFHLQIYKRDAAGTETLVRDEFSANFANTTVALQEWIAAASSAGALTATDRIVNKVYAQRVSGSTTITVTTYFEGSSHTSHIQTTISTGAQGPPGPGVPAGGTTGQVLNKTAATDYATAWTSLPTSLPPSGTATGDLSGSYPAPQIAAGVIVDADVSATAAIQYTKLTGVPTSLPGPPTGAASGDLTGTYPGPTVAKLNGATVGTTTPLARGDLLVANATPAFVRLARGTVNQVLQSDGTDVVWGPAPATGGPPTGTAGGDLSGSYPNPQLAAGVIVDADVSATAAIQYSKLTGTPTALPPNGAATGALAGTYPAPSIAASAVRGTPSSGGTAREIAKVSIWGGDDLIDLSVPTAKLAALAVTDAKINDMAAPKLTGTIAQARLPVAPSGLVTANVNDAQITGAKLAVGASVRNSTSAAAPANFTTNNVTGAWITIVTLPALVTAGGQVLLFGTAGLLYAGATNVLIILGIFRDGTQYFTIRWQPAASTGGTLGLPLPTIAVIDIPSAASHVYTLKAWVNGAGANVVTSGGDTGAMYALELC